jgi:hypothetical protein
MIRSAITFVLDWSPWSRSSSEQVTVLARNFAIPQLLRSDVWANVPLVMRGPTTVFTHRKLSPHQFTPMSRAHERPAVHAGWAVLSAFSRAWPRATQAKRWAKR